MAPSFSSRPDAGLSLSKSLLFAATPAHTPTRWSALLARVRASAWGPVVVRVLAVAIALLVLGWIGRTAAAGPSNPSSLTTTSAELDASAPQRAEATPLVSNEAGAPAADPPPASTAAPPPVASRARATEADPVYLNQASVEELRRLPGVGPKRAEAILVLRQRVGRFHRVEDLLRVKGVGRGAVKKWRPLVRLDAPSTPDAGSP
jgi:competence protein ComEA